MIREPLTMELGEDGESSTAANDSGVWVEGVPDSGDRRQYAAKASAVALHKTKKWVTSVAAILKIYSVEVLQNTNSSCHTPTNIAGAA